MTEAVVGSLTRELPRVEGREVLGLGPQRPSLSCKQRTRLSATCKQYEHRIFSRHASIGKRTDRPPPDNQRFPLRFQPRRTSPPRTSCACARRETRRDDPNPVQQVTGAVRPHAHRVEALSRPHPRGPRRRRQVPAIRPPLLCSGAGVFGVIDRHSLAVLGGGAWTEDDPLLDRIMTPAHCGRSIHGDLQRLFHGRTGQVV